MTVVAPLISIGGLREKAADVAYLRVGNGVDHALTCYPTCRQSAAAAFFLIIEHSDCCCLRTFSV